MDDKVMAVLDTYHTLMREERRHGPHTRPHGLGDGREHAFMAVGPQTGKLLSLLVASMEAPTVLELGTSLGYSGIWLAEAARRSGGRVITMEVLPHKAEYAHDMAAKAGLAEHIEFQVGDALALIEALPTGIDFVLVDLWKDLYVPCLERFYPKLNPGALIVADNILRPGGEPARQYREAVRALPGMSSVLLPVGKGLELSRFDPA